MLTFRCKRFVLLAIAYVYFTVDIVFAKPLKFHLSKTTPRLSLSSFHKRDNVVLSLKNNNDEYFSTTINLGTPSQELSVIFDTGSADLWVMNNNNPHCLNNSVSNITDSPTIDCSQITTFDYTKSTSFKKLSDDRFYINYVDETYAEGEWATDTLTINDIPISNMQFGLALNATTPVSGVLGIGFQRREAVRGYPGASNEFYPNFPEVLKQEGIVDVVAYSLNLGQTSSIIFGGLDTNAYDGDIYTFPMVNVYPTVVDKPATLSLTIQGLEAYDSNGQKTSQIFNSKYPVLLDSGTTLVSFPMEIAEKMANFVNATYSEYESIYIMDCPSDTINTGFVFDFGDLKLNISLASFILPPDGESYCGFGVLPSSGSITLGDSFLKNAYVVYDLENYQISLAAVAEDNTLDQNIIDIPNDGKIPGAIMASAVAWNSYDESDTTTSSIGTSKASFQSSTLQTVTKTNSVTKSSQSENIIFETVTEYIC
ncbi:similar to Saccharomyces cerevisiae YIL015W BAR1 Aspartyl protease secreted into the periplasmic space of mating type a cells [Maudiozyma saulgeensis]|uniref:Similar to Saccharomyces cerevisiae YIL015W BAR1 Aspartyl protease secreted into the periplasmic space of mating type a cells n=1 Tax=Maudiozyma saulgeensis TaxID=1789683 RepID=A0A1X7R659_9SACH|nr:similar to Saccharomyces cerevisiae YIL015W BAR1 Aspartyl protease secreted into the periplasmic space of mating type a cells [Kazachstania saulgeensis]